MDSRLFEILGLLKQASLLLDAELHETDSYALSDAYSLTLDAASQVRGEIKARQPEHPIYTKGAA